MCERIARTVAHDEARLDVVARGERAKIAAGMEPRESGQRGPDQQRPALPVAGEERARRAIAEERCAVVADARGGVDVTRADRSVAGERRGGHRRSVASGA